PVPRAGDAAALRPQLRGDDLRGPAGGGVRELSMTVRATLFGLGLAGLAFAWSGAPALVAAGPFSAHMIAHVTVVAVAAPLLAVAVAGGRNDPTWRWPLLAAPVPAMLAELVVVWGWHLPLPHAAARD